MREVQHRYLIQVLESDPPDVAHSIRWVNRILEEGRKARGLFKRLTEQMAATDDPMERVLLLCKRNGVAHQLSDISELMRDVREILQTPATESAA